MRPWVHWPRWGRHFLGLGGLRSVLAPRVGQPSFTGKGVLVETGWGQAPCPLPRILALTGDLQGLLLRGQSSLLPTCLHQPGSHELKRLPVTNPRRFEMPPALQCPQPGRLISHPCRAPLFLHLETGIQAPNRAHQGRHPQATRPRILALRLRVCSPSSCRQWLWGQSTVLAGHLGTLVIASPLLLRALALVTNASEDSWEFQGKVIPSGSTLEKAPYQGGPAGMTAWPAPRCGWLLLHGPGDAQGVRCELGTDQSWAWGWVHPRGCELGRCVRRIQLGCFGVL